MGLICTEYYRESKTESIDISWLSGYRSMCEWDPKKPALNIKYRKRPALASKVMTRIF
jgi:hypothetical protein